MLNKYSTNQPPKPPLSRSDSPKTPYVTSVAPHPDKITISNESRRSRRQTETPAWKAAKDIWDRNMSYSADPDIYEDKWWCKLPLVLRERLRTEANRFVSLADLHEAHMRGVYGPSINGPQEMAELTWRDSPFLLPLPDKQAFMKARNSSRQERSQFVKDCGRRTESVLKRLLGIDRHRPNKHAERDWFLTKWVVEDKLSHQQARDRWARTHPEAKPTVSATRKAVDRTNSTLEADRWHRRLYLYLVNKCPTCWGRVPERMPILEQNSQGEWVEVGIREDVPQQAPCQDCDGTRKLYT